MLKTLRENPARFAHDEMMSATAKIENVAYPCIDETRSTAEILAEIAKAESSIQSAMRYLQIAKSQVRKKPADDRVIHRDIVERYCRIYGGETVFVPTDAPDNAFVVLVDKDGQVRGEVSLFDKFPVPTVFDFSDLPY